MRHLAHLLAIGFTMLLGFPSTVLSIDSPSTCLSFPNSETVFTVGSPALLDNRCSGNVRDVTILDYRNTPQTAPVAMSGGKLRIDGLGIGWYRLRFRNEEHAFAIVPEPAEHGIARVDTALGIILRGKDITPIVKLVALAGVHSIRDRFNWGLAEPARNRFRWEPLDKKVDLLNASGIAILDQFNDVPPWARSDRERHQAPDDLRDAYHFGKAYAERYRDRVWGVQVWNEQDIPFKKYEKDQADQYAALLKSFSLGVKAGNPAMKVVLSALAHPPGKFATTVMDNDVAPYVDGYAYHYYAPRKQFAGAYAAHTEFLRDRNFDKGIYITEFGDTGLRVARRPDGSSDLPEDKERQQLNFMVENYMMAYKEDIDGAYFFVFPPFLSPNKQVQFGLLRENYEPRPAYVALAMLNHVLDGAAYRGQVEDAAHIGYVFLRPDQKMVLVAPARNATFRLALNTSNSGGIELIDALGSNREFTLQGNILTFRSSELPHFLTVPPGVNFTSLTGTGRPDRSQKDRPPPSQLAGGHNSKLVIRALYPGERGQVVQECSDYGKNECHVISPGGEGIVFDLYNFADQQFSGVLSIEGKGACAQIRTEAPATIAPQGRTKVDLPAPQGTRGICTIQAVLNSSSERSSKYVGHVVFR